MSEYTHTNDVEWVYRNIIKLNDHGPADSHPYRYRLQLPRPLADWDVWDYWEKERFASIEQHLRLGDVLFDIGAEMGWCTAILASFVGGGSVVLFEPTPQFWPNIKATWERNALAPPLGCYAGLVGENTEVPFDQDYDNDLIAGWPVPAHTDQLVSKLAYRYLHEHTRTTPQTSVDDYVSRTGHVPRALNMDVEGAELLVLRGANRTLHQHRPLVWVSIHPDLGERDYGFTPQNVHDYMDALGYRAEHLATDHEQHWMFHP